MRVLLKLVPDAEPDADGFWEEAEVPPGLPLFKLKPLTDHHIVAYRAADSLQDGGPMHAEFLYQPPAKLQFNKDWLNEKEK